MLFHLVCPNQSSIRTYIPIFQLAPSKSRLNWDSISCFSTWSVRIKAQFGLTFLFSSWLRPNQGLIGTAYRVFPLGLSESKLNSDSHSYFPVSSVQIKANWDSISYFSYMSCPNQGFLGQLSLSLSKSKGPF